MPRKPKHLQVDSRVKSLFRQRMEIFVFSVEKDHPLEDLEKLFVEEHFEALQQFYAKRGFQVKRNSYEAQKEDLSKAERVDCEKKGGTNG